MDLDQIQEMCQKDSVIDPDNLHDESLKIPQLHAKYYTLYNTITLLRERARETHNKIKLEKKGVTAFPAQTKKEMIDLILVNFTRSYRGSKNK